MTNIQKKQILPAVAIILDEQNRILLSQRHQPDSSYHGLWQFPGGGIEFGEHPREAVIREVQEEIGLTIELLTEHPVVLHHVPTDDIQIIIIGYPARYRGGEIDVSQDPETGDARWFHYDDIDFTICIPQTKDVIDAALKLTTSAK